MITQPLQYQPVLEPRSLRGVTWRQINKETACFQLRGTEKLLRQDLNTRNE